MYGDAMAGLDRWLEAPYTDAARAEAAYEAWCEREDLDPSDDHWDAFEEAQYDARDDARIEAAEAAREDRDW